MSTRTMSNKALVSIGIFLVLLVLVVVTRKDRVAEGIRTLELGSIEQADVEKIEVTGKKSVLKGGAVLSKDEKGWTVAAPDKADVRFAAEQSVVTQALETLAGLEAGSFVTGRKEKHAELEIDDEKGLFVTLHQKGKEPLSLVFGRAVQGGGNYLRLKGSDEVFVGKSSLAATLQKDVAAWRKKKLFDAELANLTSVVVEPAAGTSASIPTPYTLEAREETTGEGESATTKTTWGFASNVALPEGFRADDDLIRRVTSAVAGLRAADFVDETKSADETGLSDKPALGRVVVTTKDGKSFAVRFGKEDDKKRVYTQLEGEEQIYLLPSYQTKNVIKPLEELRDLSLARFDVSAVEGVKLTSPSGAVQLTKENGAWTIKEPTTLPEGFEFDPARVDGMLASLARLKAQERFEVPPASHGANAATTTVTLSLTGGVTKTIAFGSDVPSEDAAKKIYVTGAEEPNVYAMAQHQKSRFEKPLELFKKLPPPPQGHGGGGMIPGMENLPPDVRKKLEESLRQQGLPGR